MKIHMVLISEPCADLWSRMTVTKMWQSMTNCRYIEESEYFKCEWNDDEDKTRKVIPSASKKLTSKLKKWLKNGKVNDVLNFDFGPYLDNEKYGDWAKEIRLVFIKSEWDENAF